MNVVELWRYPVKSVGGERVPQADLGTSGLPGDRAWALRAEADGDITWAGAIPKLMQMSAVTLPGGGVSISHGAATVASLSEVAGESLSLVEHKPSDPLAAVHILSTASLRSLANALPETRIDLARFRPNIVIEVEGTGFPEHEWIGRRVQTGGATLRITQGCIRCIMINQATLTASLDRRVLEWVARNTRNVFGVYAAVEAPGPVAVGDVVSLVD